REDIAALRSIYSAGDADAADLPGATREALVKRHGYFGRVALSFGLDDNDPARAQVRAAGVRTVVVLVVAFTVAMLALLAGLVLFVIAIVKLLSPRGLRPAYAPPSFGGSVYLETFALFLAGFIGISLVTDPLNRATGASLDFALPWVLVVVPFWPLVRGQRWAMHK